MNYDYLVCNKFSGISRSKSSFSDKLITASDLQNVELFDTGINSGTGIRTALGNVSVCNLIPSGEKVIAMFQSVQNSQNYFFVYTESETEGKIYSFSPSANTLTLLLDSLSVTGNASACDYAQGYSDLFLFSNSVELVKIDMSLNSPASVFTSVDSENRNVKGSGMVNFGGRLWIFDNNILHYSVQQDFDDFATSDADIITSAGFIEYSSPITVICPFMNSLVVFFENSSVIISSPYPFSQTKSIPAGCSGKNALAIHNTQLFFYDSNKNAVFSFKEISTGDVSLQENIAQDLHEEFFNIPLTLKQKVFAHSVVTSDKNEIWWLLPSSDNNFSTILIYDSFRKTWLKRKCQKINCLVVCNSVLYSGGEKIYREYTGNAFDNVFIPSFYNCSPLNFGTDNVIKILYYPPKVSLDINYSNNFFVKYIKNYDIFNRIKIKNIKTKFLNKVLYWDIGYFDSVYCYPPDKANAVATLPPASFKILEMQFFTQNQSQEFAIKNIEFHKIKAKFSGA